MNIYEYSQQHNYEMGILVKRAEDEELYDKIHEEALRIERASDTGQLTTARIKRRSSSQQTKPATPERKSPRRRKSSQSVPVSGFCIRCRSEIPIDPSSPYCLSDYRSWNKYKNPDYQETFCHLCGNKHETSMAKPACISCYRKYRSTLQFAS